MPRKVVARLGDLLQALLLVAQALSYLRVGGCLCTMLLVIGGGLDLRVPECFGELFFAFGCSG